MSLSRDQKTRPKADDPDEKQSPEERPVASLDPACAGKHPITVTRAGEEDAQGDDRSSAASARSG